MSIWSVFASNMAIPITFAVVVTIVLSLNRISCIFSQEQREKFASARIRILNTFICALLLGSHLCFFGNHITKDGINNIDCIKLNIFGNTLGKYDFQVFGQH